MNPRRPRRATALAVAGVMTIMILIRPRRVRAGDLAAGPRAAPVGLARANDPEDPPPPAPGQRPPPGRRAPDLQVLLTGPGESHADDENGRWLALRSLLLDQRHEALTKLRASERRSIQRLRELTRRRADTDAWIRQWGILQTCPVRGPVSIADDFGVVVRIPDVPVHIHQGNDMMAATGTPIVAPFAGTAVAAPNVMGGLAVKVYGELGYVYNAHLSAYGRLGQVRAGTVIGYVGSTGDAGGSHDHFEWHPNDGPAVDPNPYLTASCG